MNSRSEPANNNFPFDLHEPASAAAPFVLNSPHSGRNYPAQFLESSRLSAHAIRSSEDFLVDELVSGAKKLGLPLLSARFPRAFLDVNREPFELDQTMFDDALPGFVNSRSVRVSSGLGTIARIVAEGEEIYASRLSVGEGLERIERYYKPYHAALRGLVARTHVRFGCAVLLDFHSMPSSGPVSVGGSRPDIVLGDRFGSSCAASVVHEVRSQLRGMGYEVELNKPYAGGFITGHYGRTESGLHALQIEINRGLYMDEAKLCTNDNFIKVRDDLTDLMRNLIGLDCSALSGPKPLAAE